VRAGREEEQVSFWLRAGAIPSPADTHQPFRLAPLSWLSVISVAWCRSWHSTWKAHLPTRQPLQLSQPALSPAPSQDGPAALMALILPPPVAATGLLGSSGGQE
jgi:hypothetical protein